MIGSLVQLSYIIAVALFIFSLHWMNDPKTARGKREILLPSFVVEMLNRHRVNQLEQKLKVGEAWTH